MAAALAVGCACVYVLTWEASVVPPVGGKDIAPGLLISVPLFLQHDPRWAEDQLGSTSSSMGSEGCAVCAVAMLFRHYGIETDPSTLNAYLSKNGGYTERGWIVWGKAAEFTGGQARFVYAGRPTHQLIDQHLVEGNPVIVKILIGGVIPHWVLVVGKEGREYLINDPLSRGASSPGKLSDYGSPIHSLRVYKPIGGHVS